MLNIRNTAPVAAAILLSACTTTGPVPPNNVGLIGLSDQAWQAQGVPAGSLAFAVLNSRTGQCTIYFHASQGLPHRDTLHHEWKHCLEGQFHRPSRWGAPNWSPLPWNEKAGLTP